VPGVYKFLFQSTGHNERGELAPREASRFLTLMQPEGTPEDGEGCLGCEGGVAAYLIGTYDLREDTRTFLHLLNPSGENVELLIAFFDDAERPVGCARDRLTPNDLLELDVARAGPQARLGVVKVVAFEPGRPVPTARIAGNQRILFGRDRVSETALHPVPDPILKGDLERIRRACG
jgi:hypothetical protein